VDVGISPDDPFYQRIYLTAYSNHHFHSSFTLMMYVLHFMPLKVVLTYAVCYFHQFVT